MSGSLKNPKIVEFDLSDMSDVADLSYISDVAAGHFNSQIVYLPARLLVHLPIVDSM